MRAEHVARRLTWRWLLATTLIAGCSSLPPAEIPATASASHEIDGTPFFAQDDHQCGPAALATVLKHTGVAVAPDDLTREIYLPGRKGSLQVELIGAVRRHERVPYTLDPSLTAVVRELEAGRPVLVLQNLGVKWWPVWHYAVVIGFSRLDETVVLRSGRTRRLVVDIDMFDKTWARAGRWAIVALPVTELPASLDRARYLEAVIDIERTGGLTTARGAYRTLLTRLPRDTAALFGFANVSQRLGEFTDAETTYRTLLEVDPADPRVLNNLSLVLKERGCLGQARAMIDAALAALPPDSANRNALEDTAAGIRVAELRAEPERCETR